MEDHLLRRVADFADAERATWVQAAACRRVAALFDAGNVAACRVSVGPLSDLEFAEALACYELELIAAGDDPVRISLQMAVMRTARDASRVRRNRCAPRSVVAPSPDTADAIRFAVGPQPAARRKRDTIPWLLSAIRSAISLPPSYVPAVISWSFSLPSGIRMVAMNDPGPTALRRGYSRR